MLITFTFFKLVINFKTSKMKIKIFMLVALFATTLSFSQRNTDYTYMTTFVYKAKDGMVEKFEKAADKKTKMFNKEEGSIIFTYKVLTGSDAGVYERYLVGQSPAHYDMDRSDELEYWAKNVAPYADPVGGQQRWEWQEWGTIGDQPEPPKFFNKTILRYKPSMSANVSRYIYRQGKVLEKRNPNAFRRVFEMVSGGDLNAFVIFSGFDKYDAEWPETDTTWEEDYNEMFGWEQFSQDQKLMQKSLRDWNGATRTTLERIYF
jgi:hypothetical protein